MKMINQDTKLFAKKAEMALVFEIDKSHIYRKIIS